MKWPSFSLIVSGLFVAYILHSLWVVSQLFIPPSCTRKHFCIKSFLKNSPKLQLVAFSSLKVSPRYTSEVTLVDHVEDFDYVSSFEREISVSIPEKTRRNGTLYLHVCATPKENRVNDWLKLTRDPLTVCCRVKLTKYHVPEAETFNLLGKKKANLTARKTVHTQVPVSHFKSRVVVTIMADNISLPRDNLPMEIGHVLRFSPKAEFLPILLYSTISDRLRDLVEIKESSTVMNATFIYSPISFGKLRFWLNVETALSSLHSFGFTEKDTDEVKGIFADTNLYFLCVTVIVAALHMLFDFLAFKNDIMFWKRRKTLVGLSTRTVVWRAFSQSVVFLYLLDEETSLLVLVPSGIGALIEMWKVTKVLRVQVNFRDKRFIRFGSASADEAKTEAFDAESMKYLMYVLYPLCIGGAGYSLLYMPHRSWYSWTINSLVNGVYAFGFLFMLPQLFVNYRLKSVAHLPWKAFMYKAFNTFIDDLFAFIITMPTAHRVACFRDDIVFLIYLYQRWLYPVDKSRLDELAASQGEIDDKVKND